MRRTDIGIILRDLKHQNIMQIRQAASWDGFWLGAFRSVEGMTQTGALLGTIDTCRPSRHGKNSRPALHFFAVGLIFYEL